MALGILGVSVAKLVIQLKQGKAKNIFYENSHHDHHYDHEHDYGGYDDIWEEHPGKRRSTNAQKLAYSGYNKNNYWSNLTG